MTKTVDVLEGNTFVVSDERGDIDGSPVEAHGLFDRDTRYLSRWVLTLDGERPATLSVDTTKYYSAQFFLAPGVASAYINAKVAVIRQRTVLDGFHETVSVTNHDSKPATFEVALAAAADFADLFQVKDATVEQKAGRTYRRVEADRLVLGYERDAYRRETWLRATGEPRYSEEGLSFTVTLAPQESWSTDIDVLAVRGGDAAPAFPERAAWSDPEARLGLKLLQQSLPVMSCSWKPLERIYAKSVGDLAALRFDLPISPGSYLPAAGLPWFMAAFGRDSLITSFQALPFIPELAHTALVTLAELQAVKRDDFRDAEPGKMLHELRFGELTAFEERPHSPYYGSADGTQLWLVLLDEYERWTGRADVVHALEGPARAALRWMDEYGDRDGDGYVEYERRAETGLENQCWRDSWDSIQSADGTLSSLPRATCELQGYVYDAKRRSARLAREIWDDAALADRLEEEAADLKTRFNRDFWLPDRGFYALALDGEKRPVDSLTSNLGHLLWSGIVDDDRVERVVELLMGDRLYSGWGIRTFATGQVGYNPIGYHLGTVWPHDTAFAVLALAQRGYRAEAARVAMSLLEAADLLGDRLPEAFAGFPREQTAFPAEYPTACSPQAWASGAPLLLLRALLGMEPDGAVLRSTASLPEQIRELRLYRVPGRWGVADVGVDLTGQVIRLDQAAGAEPSPVLQSLIEAAQQMPADALRGRRLSIGFDIGEAGRYRVVGEDGRVSLDSHVDAADCVLTTDEETLGELLRGERNPTTTLMSGRARLHGDVELATRMLAFLARLGVPTG